MCNTACINFVKNNLSKNEIKGKRVLEIGSRNVNGSVRPYVEKNQPKEYIGIDIRKGDGVDIICDVNNIQKQFGTESFDIIIATELLEHIKNWRIAIMNIKNVLKKDGIILITTRSKGLGFHGFPYDYWRFEVNDMKKIFSDYHIQILVKDPIMPGVFVKAQKPKINREIDISKINLYSILKEKKISEIKKIDLYLFLTKYVISKSLPPSIKKIIKKTLNFK